MRQRTFLRPAIPVGLAFVLGTAPLALAAGAIPACKVIRGSAAVTFTTNDGATLTPTALPLQGVSYTFGLVALDIPNTLLATVGSQLLTSTNRGCRWTQLANLSQATGGALLTLTAAPGGRAYAWVDNGRSLFRIDGRRVTRLSPPVTSILGLGVHPRDPKLVRLADAMGTLWTSMNAGVTWKRTGIPPVLSIFRAAFDPANLDHVVLGTSLSGAFVTLDGGRTWTQSGGVASVPGGPVNVFNGVISPADSRVVWLVGIDLTEADTPGAPFEGRHIYRSVDGGFSFVPVIDRTADVVLRNGPIMAAHPANADVLYFVFGTPFEGTDLYRYDASTDLVTKAHNAYDDISAIAFSPSSPGVIYLGLVSEQGD